MLFKRTACDENHTFITSKSIFGDAHVSVSVSVSVSVCVCVCVCACV